MTECFVRLWMGATRVRVLPRVVLVVMSCDRYFQGPPVFPFPESDEVELASDSATDPDMRFLSGGYSELSISHF